jgi:protease-4
MKSFIKYCFATAFGVFIGSSLFVVMGVVMVVGFVTLSQQELQTKLKSETANIDQVLMLKFNYKINEKSNSEIMGVIDPSYAHYFNEGIGLYNIRKALKTAAADKKIKSIFLNLSVVHAGWSTLSSIREALLDFKKSKKSITAYAPYYSEKSYFLASVASKIYMHNTGEFELDGLSLSPMFMKGLMDKMELKPQIFRVGTYKAAVEPFLLKKMSAANRAQSIELIQGVWDEYKSNIAIKSIDKLAEAFTIKSAANALEHKLITGLKQESLVRVEVLEQAKIEKDQKEKFVTLLKYMGKHSAKKYLSGDFFKNFAKKQKAEAAPKKEKKVVKKNKIALIFMEGTIVNGHSKDKNSVGDADIVHALRQAREDESVAGVILRINSPGGSALASDIIWQEIELLKKTKKYYASFGDVAASGGYYVAAGASKIFARENTITGSIGVFGIMFNTQKFFEKNLGITFDNVRTHKFAGLGDSTRPMSPEDKAIIQGSVERVYKEFTTVVSRGRSLTMKMVLKIAGGRVWIGSKAKELGLVDEIGGLNKAIESMGAELKIKDPVISIFPKVNKFKGLFSSLLKGVSLYFKNEMGLEIPFAKKALKASELLKSKGIYTLMPLDYNIN